MRARRSTCAPRPISWCCIPMAARNCSSQARESNIDKIGHLNVGSALHPVVLKDGRIIFSSLESQGLRDRTKWGIWSIHPDGTNWGPAVSAYENHSGGIFHFQAQLSDESIVVGDYYILAMGGFGTY